MEYRIVDQLQKMDRDIQKEELNYHSKRVLISKEFTFDASHHLHCYEGKCKNLHGHTYKAILGISGYTDETGLVMDFADLKAVWKEELEVYLDHRYLNETLPKMNTTAENIVVWIYENLAKALADRPEVREGVHVEFVRLYETPTSFAEARREWMEID
jgi:6-pyruvoyltetrahydropterin/6-carboxytetrahydropterin synthase